MKPVPKPNVNEIKDFPHHIEGAKLLIDHGILYVVLQDTTYDKTIKRGRDKRTYLGRVVDGRYYPMDDYKRLFKRGGGRRVVQDDVFLPDIKSIAQNVGLDMSSGPVKLGSRNVGPVPLFYAIAKEIGLIDDLKAVYGEVRAKILLSLSFFQILSRSNSFYRYDDITSDTNLPFSGRITATDISLFTKEIGSLTDRLELFFTLRTKRLNEDELISYDGTSIDNGSENSTNTAKGKNKSGSVSDQINFSFCIGHRSRSPAFFKITSGNCNDLMTVPDFFKRIKHNYRITNRVVLDRGYFDKSTIQAALEQDINLLVCAKIDNGWVKAIAKRVSKELYAAKNYISDQDCYGCTQIEVFNTAKGKQPVWVNVFFNPYLHNKSKNEFLIKLETFKEAWAQQDHTLSNKDKLLKFFTEGKSAQLGDSLTENWVVIEDHISTFGMYASVSTTETTARQAAADYAERDREEKTYKGIKTNLGISAFRGHSDETIIARLLITFITSSIHNEILRRMALCKITKAYKNGNVTRIPPVKASLSFIRLMDKLKNIDINVYGDKSVAYSEISSDIHKYMDLMQVPDAYKDIPDYILCE